MSRLRFQELSLDPGSIGVNSRVLMREVDVWAVVVRFKTGRGCETAISDKWTAGTSFGPVQCQAQGWIVVGLLTPRSGLLNFPLVEFPTVKPRSTNPKIRNVSKYTETTERFCAPQLQKAAST